VHKHGWQTSEFWLTTLVSLPAFLVSAGIIPSADQTMISDSLSKVMSGLVAAVALWKYIHSRMHVKAALYDNAVNPIKTALPLVMLALLCGTGEASAQNYYSIFGLRNGPNYSAPLSTIIAQNNQILAQNQQIIMLLMNQQTHPAAPAPQQQPIIVFAPPSQGGPSQQIPLGNPPLQQIPLGGPPAQQIPLGGPPLQQIPLGNPPSQQIPLGQPPVQQIPLGNPAPIQQPPAQPKPGTNPPQQIPLGNPPAAPTGYQTYTRALYWPRESPWWPSASASTWGYGR
jgi:hypothetical protein